MTNKLAYLASVARSDDFAAVCNLLSFYAPGEEVPEPEEIAATLNIDVDVVRFSLDTLFECSAIIREAA